MTDYYSILGLTKNASDFDIKTAFRKLAKRYHPDKNPDDPNANVLFESILKAYTILIDPSLRKQYDSGYAVSTTSVSSRSTTHRKSHKEWNFTEEDIKRRQYYQKYYQTKKQTFAAEAKNKSHSDYKYILFATPLAVGLLMLILSVFTDTPGITEKLTDNTKQSQVSPPEYLHNGDTPYGSYFGNIKTFDTKNTLRISNETGYEAVIALFDKETDNYLQHAYIQPNYYIEFSLLPLKGVYWKSFVGKGWNKEKMIFDQKIMGGFDSTIQYQNRKAQPAVFKMENFKKEALKIITDSSEDKQYISRSSDFFEK